MSKKVKMEMVSKWTVIFDGHFNESSLKWTDLDQNGGSKVVKLDKSLRGLNCSKDLKWTVCKSERS